MGDTPWFAGGQAAMVPQLHTGGTCLGEAEKTRSRKGQCMQWWVTDLWG